MTLSDDRSMRKGWLYYSLIIGIAATLIAYAIVVLANITYTGQSQMLDQLSKDGSLSSIPFDMYTISNSPFFLTAIGILLLEFLCGLLSFLFARSASGKTDNWYVASLVTGLLPAVIYGIFAFNNWANSVSRYESHTNVRPSEPAPPFIVVGLICFEMAVCLLASVAGGWLAQAALKSETRTE
jgi:hypothetical protein